jgi:hypothetical protein
MSMAASMAASSGGSSACSNICFTEPQLLRKFVPKLRAPFVDFAPCLSLLPASMALLPLLPASMALLSLLPASMALLPLPADISICG